MSKSKNHAYDDYDDYDDNQYNVKKQQQSQRRQIKNWKKAWTEHENDYDEMDDFYSKYDK
jgi:hypothetical protein